MHHQKTMGPSAEVLHRWFAEFSSGEAARGWSVLATQAAITEKHRKCSGNLLNFVGWHKKKNTSKQNTCARDRIFHNILLLTTLRRGFMKSQTMIVTSIQFEAKI